MTPRKAADGTWLLCSIEGCENPVQARGFCRKHYFRIRKWGDPHAGDRPRGAAHRNWKGDEATYFTVHKRLRAERGSARSHPCVDCGGPATAWSYDKLDPKEKDDGLGPYSTDLAYYQARCRSCHTNLDTSFGEDHPQTRISNEDVIAIKAAYAAGEPVGSIAAQFGLSKQHVCGIGKGTQRRRG